MGRKPKPANSMTSSEVAKALGIARRKISEACHTGVLIKVGKCGYQVCYSRQSVEAYARYLKYLKLTPKQLVLMVLSLESDLAVLQSPSCDRKAAHKARCTLEKLHPELVHLMSKSSVFSSSA